DYTSRRFIRTAGHAGTGGLGEVRNMGGANSFAGDINFNLGTVVGVDSGSSFETYGGLWGAATTARTMRKVGSGEWIISGTNDGTNGNINGAGNGGNVQFG